MASNNTIDIQQDSDAGKNNRGLDLIHGPILSTTLKLAGPIIVSQFLQLAIGVADIVMIGHIKVHAKEALAALVTSNNLLMLLMAIGFGIGFATITNVSQHTGAGRDEAARRSASHTLMIGMILGIIMIVLAKLFLPNLLGFYNSEPRVTDFAMTYTRIIFDFMPLFFLLFLGVSIMQGLGDTVTPLFIMLFTNAVNILLNYMLIYGKWGAPELGIAGSATGSTIARGLGTVIILIFLMSGKYRMKLKLYDFRPYLSEFKAILRLGIPNSIQNVSRNINVLFLYRILSYTYLPTVAQASLGVGFNSEAIGFIPLMGLFTATGTMVGQNLGAGNPERASQAAWSAWKSGLSLMVIICLLFLLIPEKIVGAFNTDPSVIQSGSWYLRINAITQIFQSGFVFVGCLRGAGDSMRPLGAHLIGNWIIRLPLAYFLSTYTGLEEWGVWLAMAISASIECTIYLYLFMKGDWKKVVLR